MCVCGGKFYVSSAGSLLMPHNQIISTSIYNMLDGVDDLILKWDQVS